MSRLCAGAVVQTFAGAAGGRGPFRHQLPRHDSVGGGVQGPFTAPGTYQVRMTVNGVTQTQPFQVKKQSMHTDVTDADLQEQFDLVIRIRDKTSEANQAVIDIRRIKADVSDRSVQVT